MLLAEGWRIASSPVWRRMWIASLSIAFLLDLLDVLDGPDQVSGHFILALIGTIPVFHFVWVSALRLAIRPALPAWRLDLAYWRSLAAVVLLMIPVVVLPLILLLVIWPEAPDFLIVTITILTLLIFGVLFSPNFTQLALSGRWRVECRSSRPWLLPLFGASLVALAPLFAIEMLLIEWGYSAGPLALLFGLVAALFGAAAAVFGASLAAATYLRVVSPGAPD